MEISLVSPVPQRHKAGNALRIAKTSRIRKDERSQAVLKPSTHGQVFTPDWLVTKMLALRQNKGRILEPSCGSGAFSNGLHDAGDDLVALELDAEHAPEYARVMDFFDYPTSERFSTIVGNPPFLRHQSISGSTKEKLGSTIFNGRANLYLYFIEKCIQHLDDKGELIFVVPRDFPKATAARRLNQWLFLQGTITDFWETGDTRIFKGATPPCCIFRFEKGRFDRAMSDGRVFAEHEGQLFFHSSQENRLSLSSLFDVSVGGLTGADKLFISSAGNLDVVYSKTVSTGQPRKMLDETQVKSLLASQKTKLLARRVRKFSDLNWWKWGRDWKRSDAPRVYVNALTRNSAPFFTNDCTAYDASVLALFPKLPGLDPASLAVVLNAVDWEAYGFKVDGRFIFTQRSLENCPLPETVIEQLKLAAIGPTSSQ